MMGTYKDPIPNRRSSSFCKAMAVTRINGEADSQYMATLRSIQSNNAGKDEDDSHLPKTLHIEINYDDIIKNNGPIPRTHSSDSTSSDVSLLSARSLTPTSTSRIVWIVILVFALLSVTSFLYLLLKLKTMEHELKTLNGIFTGFCVPCVEVILGPFEHDNKDLQRLEKRTVGDVEVCCATNANQTLILTNLIIERNRQKYETKHILHVEKEASRNEPHSSSLKVKQPPIAAHLLVGLQTASETGTELPSPVNNFQSSDPTTFVSGLKVTNDTIIVNRSGLYFIYSQIHFSKIYSENNKRKTTSQALYHYVYRYNAVYPNGGTELLLMSVQTQCWDTNKMYGDYTSYTAAVLELKAGDQLYIMVSDITVVSREPKGSFLGIVKVS